MNDNIEYYEPTDKEWELIEESFKKEEAKQFRKQEIDERKEFNIFKAWLTINGMIWDTPKIYKED